MKELYIHLFTTIFIYITIFLQILFLQNNTIITKQLIKFWFENNVVLTETNNITRTSDLFNNFCLFIRIKYTTKQDLILFGKLLKKYIKEHNIPLSYKKGRYAGYTNIKALI